MTTVTFFFSPENTTTILSQEEYQVGSQVGHIC